jgi:hypothetical protein
VDLGLITLLKASNITSKTGDSLEESIRGLMKRHGYVI